MGQIRIRGLAVGRAAVSAVLRLTRDIDDSTGLALSVQIQLLFLFRNPWNSVKEDDTNWVILYRMLFRLFLFISNHNTFQVKTLTDFPNTVFCSLLCSIGNLTFIGFQIVGCVPHKYPAFPNVSWGCFDGETEVIDGECLYGCGSGSVPDPNGVPLQHPAFPHDTRVNGTCSDSAAALGVSW